MEGKTRLYAVVVAVMLAAAGREVCGQLVDYKGKKASVYKLIS